MNMKREPVPLLVMDVDRAKGFYAERLGFVEDVDVRPGAARKYGRQWGRPGGGNIDATPAVWLWAVRRP